MQESSAPAGQMVLYFGCRRSDQDYLYGPLLEEWAAKGDITLFTAFSRQQVCECVCVCMYVCVHSFVLG